MRGIAGWAGVNEARVGLALEAHEPFEQQGSGRSDELPATVVCARSPGDDDGEEKDGDEELDYFYDDDDDDDDDDLDDDFDDDDDLDDDEDG